MKAIIALAVKDLRLLTRDRAGFFFTFFFPLAVAIFFGSIFSGDGGARAMKILVVDEDQTAGSGEFIARLEQAPELSVIRSGREEAVEKVRKGQVFAYVVVPRGFSEANPFGGSPPQVEMGVDPSRKAESGMLVGVLTRYAGERMSEFFTDGEKSHSMIENSLKEIQGNPQIPEEQRRNLELFFGQLSDLMKNSPPEVAGQGAAMQPLKVQTSEVAVQRIGPKNAYEVSFPQGVIWGVLGCAAAFAISIVAEKNRGTLVRLRMAPIGAVHILAGKAVACLTATIGVSTILLWVATFVFGIRTHSVLLLIAAVIAVAVCFVGLMMLLSSLAPTEQSAGGVGWAVFLVMSMIGGGMIPLFAMPAWMQTLSHASPVKWSILALEGAIWRGFSAGEMLFPLGLLATVGLVCFGLGVRTLKWTV